MNTRKTGLILAIPWLIVAAVGLIGCDGGGGSDGPETIVGTWTSTDYPNGDLTLEFREDGTVVGYTDPALRDTAPYTFDADSGTFATSSQIDYYIFNGSIDGNSGEVTMSGGAGSFNGVTFDIKRQ